MKAVIRAVEYHLPATVLTTEALALEFPEWSVQKIDEKTGIRQRHIAAQGECSSDLAVAAAEKLFASAACRPSDVDFILLCTQSPDYLLPTTACLLQDRLAIPSTAGALDFNLGCSGFVYGLGLAQGLIETGQASRVLLITAETYSKFLHPRDKSVRTIFGDAAAATLVEAADIDEPALGPYVFGTDGRGGPNLIVPTGGLREPRSADSAVEATDESGNVRTRDHLFMNGPELFSFTMSAVPKCVSALLTKAALGKGDIDLYLFHQANAYMLENLRRRSGIPPERFPVMMGNSGNTVSSTIPILLKDCLDAGRIRPGHRLMLAGFGVGYSWAAALARWTAA